MTDGSLTGFSSKIALNQASTTTASQQLLAPLTAPTSSFNAYQTGQSSYLHNSSPHVSQDHVQPQVQHASPPLTESSYTTQQTYNNDPASLPIPQVSTCGPTEGPKGTEL